MVGCGQIGQGIAAKNRRVIRIDKQPQDHKLTSLEKRKRLTIDGRQNEGSYAIAFLVDISDSHFSESEPCWCWFLIRQPSISRGGGRAQVLLEHHMKRRLPTCAKRRNSKRPFQLFARMSWQVQETVNAGHRHPFRAVGNFHDIVACTHFSFLQDTKVESWPVMGYEQGWHARFIQANTHAVAGYARLCHFKYRVTNAVSIANADLVIKKSPNREVFSELTEDKVTTSEKTLPVVIGVHLINKNGALLATMTGQIALPVAIDIELAHHLPSLDWRFPDGGADSLTVPRHIARKTDIH